MADSQSMKSASGGSVGAKIIAIKGDQMLTKEAGWVRSGLVVDGRPSRWCERVHRFAMFACFAALAGCGGSEGSSARQEGWKTVEIVDVGSKPWDASAPYGRTKDIMTTDKGGHFRYVLFPPTWDTTLRKAGTPGNVATPHYHRFHEWAYILAGDYVIYEPATPYQRNPVLYRYLEGTWLDRPAYTLHSGDWATGGVRSQNANVMIIFEEGNVSGAIAPEGKIRRGPSSATGEFLTDEPDWRKVAFNHPWIVNSGSDMEWEKDAEIEGRMVKWLSDDPVQGFRAQLVKVPPGWTPPQNVAAKSYFKDANRIRYVLYGDLQVWTFKDSEDTGTPVQARKDFFIYQPARSIWGYGEGPVTDEGAVWLEVTYAKGLEVGGGAIEEATVIR